MTTKTASGTASAVCLAVNDSNNGQLPVLAKEKSLPLGRLFSFAFFIKMMVKRQIKCNDNKKGKENRQNVIESAKIQQSF